MAETENAEQLKNSLGVSRGSASTWYFDEYGNIRCHDGTEVCTFADMKANTGYAARKIIEKHNLAIEKPNRPRIRDLRRRGVHSTRRRGSERGTRSANRRNQRKMNEQNKQNAVSQSVSTDWLDFRGAQWENSERERG